MTGNLSKALISSEERFLYQLQTFIFNGEEFSTKKSKKYKSIEAFKDVRLKYIHPMGSKCSNPKG